MKTANDHSVVLSIDESAVILLEGKRKIVPCIVSRDNYLVVERTYLTWINLNIFQTLLLLAVRKSNSIEVRSRQYLTFSEFASRFTGV